MANLTKMSICIHGRPHWTHLREKVEKLNHLVNSTEFLQVSTRVDEDVHKNGPAEIVL